MFRPCFGLSLQKGLKYIAMADLLICILFSTLRIAVFFNQEHSHNETETEIIDSVDGNQLSNFKPTHVDYIAYNANKTNTWAVQTDDVIDTSTSEATESVLTSNETNFPSIPNGLENKGFSLVMDHFAIFVVLVLVGLVIYFCKILLEVWMCRLLLSASSKRDTAACKKWFWIRLTLTVITCIGCILGIATFKNDWVDWILDSLTIYRVYELFVVNEFRKEILATSGVVRFGV